MVDVVFDSSDRVMSLEVVVDSSAFELHCRSSFDASISKSGMSTSVLNKFIIGKRCLMH